jgi:hypothetical protein
MLGCLGTSHQPVALVMASRQAQGVCRKEKTIIMFMGGFRQEGDDTPCGGFRKTLAALYTGCTALGVMSHLLVFEVGCLAAGWLMAGWNQNFVCLLNLIDSR